MKSTSSNKRSFTVGVFIFLGIAIFVVTILTLGGQKKVFKDAITIKALFDDVQGLQKGNNVWFSGVKIGTVKKISFYGSSKVEVDINIEESSKQYIRRDAKAKIGSDGLIGNRIVVIYGGTEKAPAVQSGDVLKVDKAFTTDEMLNTLQDNNKNLLAITTDFKEISARVNSGQGTIGKLLTDESLLNEMQRVMATLKSAANNTEKLTNTVASYAAQLNKKGSLANDLVTDTLLFAKLRATATQIDEMSRTGNAVINDLKTASQTINQSLNDKNSPVGLLLKDEGTARELRSTLHNLNTSSQKLDENLEALQHNFLLRGFFRKRAKQEQKDAEEAAKRAAENGTPTQQ